MKIGRSVPARPDPRVTNQKCRIGYIAQQATSPTAQSFTPHLSASAISLPTTSSPQSVERSLTAPSYPHAKIERKLSERERMRAAHFADAADASNPGPILRAATEGLPHTLTQLELVSDVATMP